jgi:NarL family two-component system response regulator LiaR
MLPGLLMKNKHVLLYGTCMALLLFLLKWLELRFVILDHSFEVYIGAVALLFTCLGVWVGLKLTKPKTRTVVVEKEVYIAATPFVLDEKELANLALTRRELEVLQLMAEGLSNHEIAERLFVSLSTVKTHAAKLFEKMAVERRTQAVQKGKLLRLIP